MSQKITFTRASIMGQPKVFPLTLEANVDNHLVATLAKIDNDWCILVDSHDKIVTVKLDTAFKIIGEFAQFISDSSLIPSDDSTS